METKLLLRASTTAFALGLLAQPAAAEIPLNPWYVGVAAGTMNVEVFNPVGFFGSWEEGPSRSSQSLHVGYRASRRFAVELTTLREANLSWAGSAGSYDSEIRFDVKATEIAAVGIFSAGPIFEAYGKLGLADYDLAGNRTLDPLIDSYWSPAVAISERIDESGQGFLMGVGLGANLTPRWSMRLDWQSFYIDSSFIGTAAEYDDAMIDTVSLAASYRFGGGGAK